MADDGRHGLEVLRSPGFHGVDGADIVIVVVPFGRLESAQDVRCDAIRAAGAFDLQFQRLLGLIVAAQVVRFGAQTVGEGGFTMTLSIFEIQLYPRSMDEFCISGLKNDYSRHFYIKNDDGQSRFGPSFAKARKRWCAASSRSGGTDCLAFR
jgi:hypothetical protein